MNISIKKRIYLSFMVCVGLLAVNAATAIYTLEKNKSLTTHATEVIDPSLEALGNFEKMMMASKMYAGNWVFLPANETDKMALLRIHSGDYRELKLQLQLCSSKWERRNWADSLDDIFMGFEQVITHQKNILNSLNSYKDYSDGVKKLNAEQELKNGVFPQTTDLIEKLKDVMAYEQSIKLQEEHTLKNADMNLRMFIIYFTAIMVGIALLLSIYMARVITGPIRKIIHIINNLGRGIILKVDYPQSNDEIGSMVQSVNNLSDKLNANALFAKEIGNRNFKVPFQPLSKDDTLGNALIAMRDNLQNSDERLNEAQHISHMGSWERNLVTEKIFWSDEMYNIFEINRNSEISFQSYLDLVHPDELEYVKSVASKYLIDLQPFCYQCRIKTTKGNEKVIYVQGKVIISGNEVVKTYGVVQDITETKKAEETIAESEKKYRTLFEKMLDGFYKSTKEGKFIEVNPACVKMLGYNSKEELLAIDIKSELYFETSERDEAVVQNNTEGMAVFRLRKKDGSEIWVEDRGQYVKDENGNTLYHEGTMRDVTERIKAQRDMLRKNAELQKTNEELDKFVYSVSHDLRAPLLSMQGVVNITAEETTEELTIYHMKMLSGSISRLDTFIGEILNYSQNARSELAREKINFKELVNEITQGLKYISLKNGRVKIQTDITEKGIFFSDKKRISLVLNNLISNSIRYHNPYEDKPFVKINVVTNEKDTKIEVEDNGIGIDKEYQNKVFEMFYRVSEISNGSGLGLYVVKETIDKLHGNISVQSERGIGTKFSLSIPNLVYEEVRC